MPPRKKGPKGGNTDNSAKTDPETKDEKVEDTTQSNTEAVKEETKSESEQSTVSTTESEPKTTTESNTAHTEPPKETIKTPTKPQTPPTEDVEPPKKQEPEEKVEEPKPTENVTKVSSPKNQPEIKPETPKKVTSPEKQPEPENSTVESKPQNVESSADRANQPNIEHKNESGAKPTVTDPNASLTSSWQVVNPDSSEGASTKPEASSGSQQFDDLSLKSGSSRPSIDSLASLNKTQSLPQTTPQDRITEATRLYNSGQAFKKNSKYTEAINSYAAALEAIEPKYFEKSEDLQRINALSNEYILETAYCHFELKNTKQAEEYTNMVLAKDPKNSRALELQTKLQPPKKEAEKPVETKKSEPEPAPKKETQESAPKSTSVSTKAPEEQKSVQSSNVQKSGQQGGQTGSQVSGQKTTTEQPKEEKKQSGEGESLSSFKYFIGSFITAGSIGYLVSKFALKLPAKKSLTVSLGTGALFGVLALITDKVASGSKGNDKK